MRIRDIQADVHALAREKGWWTDPETGAEVDAEKRIPEAIALVHSELSEALEEYRRGTLATYYAATGKPEGFAVELADAVIRILDLSGALGLDLEAAIAEKHAFNRTRPYRHGGRRA